MSAATRVLTFALTFALGSSHLLAAVSVPVGAEEKAPAARDPQRTDVDASLRILLVARFFVGGTIGLGAEVTRTFEAYRELADRAEAAPFLTLLRSRNSAARLYGLQGLVDLNYRGDRAPLLALLDDEDEVHTFFNCVHARSVVAIEAFGRLDDLLAPGEFAELNDEIFRQAVRTRARSSVKLRMALLRARGNPTPASLGFLLHANFDEEGAAALLDETEVSAEASAELHTQRVRAVRGAIERELSDLRLMALRVAVDIDPAAFFETIARSCRAEDLATATAALGAMTVLIQRTRWTQGTTADRAKPEPSPATGHLDRDAVLRSALKVGTSTLEGPEKRRQAGATVLIALAQALRGHDSPPTSGRSAPADLERELRAALAVALDSMPLRSLELVTALARLDGSEELIEIWSGDFSTLDPRALPILLTALDSPAHRSRLLERARRLTSDAETPWKLRLYAVRSLGYVRDPTALPILENLTGSDDARLATEAKKAIGRITRDGGGGGGGAGDGDGDGRTRSRSTEHGPRSTFHGFGDGDRDGDGKHATLTARKVRDSRS